MLVLKILHACVLVKPISNSQIESHGHGNVNLMITRSKKRAFKSKVYLITDFTIMKPTITYKVLQNDH